MKFLTSRQYVIFNLTITLFVGAVLGFLCLCSGKLPDIERVLIWVSIWQLILHVSILFSYILIWALEKFDE